MVTTERKKIIQPLISIVVPIHQMSKKLSNLKSWVTDSPLCVEIILLHDDHDFDDATNAEIEKIVDVTENSIMFRKHWGNPGDVRNFGKDIARGAWIIFADSDDYLYINEVVSCVRKLDEAKVDIIIGQFEFIKDRSRRLEKTRVKEDVIKTLGNWRIIYKKTLIMNITFPPLRMGEDQVFFCKALDLDPQIKICDRTLYSYHTAVSGQLTSKRLYDDMSKAISIIEDIFLVSKSNKRIIKGLLMNQSISMFFNQPTLQNARKLSNVVFIELNLMPYSILILTKLLIYIVKRKVVM